MTATEAAITPERFWEAFAAELRQAITKRGPAWPTIYSRSTPWTDLIVGEVLPAVGTTLGFVACGKSKCKPISKEWCYVDMGYFRICDPISRIDENWDWEVAIEHENAGYPAWISEFVKLTHINCGLKVLITYHNYSGRTQLQDVLSTAKCFYTERRYRTPDDRWVLIFGPGWEQPLAHDFIAYGFDGNEFTPLTEKRVIL